MCHRGHEKQKVVVLFPGLGKGAGLEGLKMMQIIDDNL